MNRRNFIGKTGLIGAAVVLPISSFSMFEKSKYKMGLQLYTINEDMIKDPIASLKIVKAMGYQDFETFGFDSEKETFYGYKF